MQAKKEYEQNFIFAGDSSIFYSDGIKNKFMKKVFHNEGFVMQDLLDHTFIGRLMGRLCKKTKPDISSIKNNNLLLLNFIIYGIAISYLRLIKKKVIRRLLLKISPSAVLTDESMTDSSYIPNIFREMAGILKIPVFIFSHGAAGGLHAGFSNSQFDDYKGSFVFASNRYEIPKGSDNRILLGDVCTYEGHLNYIHSLKYEDIQFGKKYKTRIGFIVSGTSASFTSTNAWFKMEEIIIDLSNNRDIAIIVKLHPREAPYIDLRILNTFNNVKIVGREVDRSKVVKWANVLVFSDHCSAVFEPMILGKKVVAIEGKHIPIYRNVHSPLKNSSLLHITSPDQFVLSHIPRSDINDPIINEIAWGNNGRVNLAKMLLGGIKIRLMR